MPALTLPSLPRLGDLFACLPPWMALRIDVQRPDESIESELDTLYRRLHTAAAPLAACTARPGPRPGLVWRHREADGEHYVYVEDTARGCQIGRATSELQSQR